MKEKQTARGIWRQSRGWIETETEIYMERESERGKETHGFDYKPMMSCMYVR